MNPDKDETDSPASVSTIRFFRHSTRKQGPPSTVSIVAIRQSLLRTRWAFLLLVYLLIGHWPPHPALAQTVRWKSLGLRDVPIIDLVVDERNPDVQTGGGPSVLICAITPTSVFISRGDTSWYEFNNSLSPVECFPYTAHSNFGLLCATEHELMQSSPLGSDWDIIGSGFGSRRSVVSLSVARSSPEIIYAVTSEKNSSGSDDELLKTTNGGKRWFALRTLPRLTSPTSLHSVYVDPHRSTTIYASMEIAGFPWLLKSTDGGARWEEIRHFFGVREILELSFDPVVPDLVYFIGTAGREHGIYKSTDGLLTYECAMKAKRLFRLVVHPTNRQILYSLELPHTIHVSATAGESWSSVSTTGLPSKCVALSMTVDSHNTLYLGTAKHGVFSSEQKIGKHISSLKALGSTISVSAAGKRQ